MSRMQKCKRWFAAFCYEYQGTKPVLRLSRVALVFMGFALPVMLFTLWRADQPKSHITKSPAPLYQEEVPKNSVISYENVKGLTELKTNKKSHRSQRRGAPKLLSFSGPMVIENPNLHSNGNVNILTKGILMSDIDTRFPAKVQILLSVGVSQSEKELLPAQTIVTGTFSYPGSGKHLGLNLTSATLPNGKILGLKAQIRSASGPKLKGRRHRNSAKKWAAAVGGTVLGSGMDVLTERESLNEYGQPAVKSTFKNAFLQGGSQVAQMEAERHLQDMGNHPEYLTVDAGESISILIQSIGGKQ